MDGSARQHGLSASARRVDVLHVVHSMGVGGAEVDLLRKCRWLLANGDRRMAIVCLVERGALASDFEALGIPFTGPIMANRRDPRVVLRLRSVIRDLAPRIVHSHLLAVNAVVDVTLSTLRTRPTWIASEHSTADRWNRIWLSRNRSVARRASAMTFPTHASLSSFEEVGVVSPQPSVVFNSVDLDAIDALDAASARRDVRRELSLDDDAIVACAVSRLHPIKDLPVLFEAVARHPVQLLVAGDGPERTALAALVRERSWEGRIHLLGRREDVPRLLAASDLFVSASLAESFGIALGEAIAMGLPFVATEVGGVPELVGKDAQASLVPAGDLAALSSAIGTLLGDVDTARARAHAARNHVRGSFAVESVASALGSLYDTWTASTRSG